MKWLTSIWLLVTLSQSALSQDPDTVWFKAFKNSAMYSDAHSHTGYKKYFRLSTDEVMQLLRAARYSADGNSISFDPVIARGFHRKNWEPYNRTVRALRKGEVATVKKYDQNSYAEIKYVPGSVLINSFSPYEKQFALDKLKRRISNVLVSNVSMDRLNATGEGVYTPLKDFLAEYYFNLMQVEEGLVITNSPDFIYRKDGKSLRENPVYYDKIRMMRDKKELDSALALNDKAFRNWNSFADTPRLITPMIMSVEGAQVLYGELSGDRKAILNPLNVNASPQKYFKAKTDAEFETIKKELLDNVKFIKNLPHRMFCIILAHFAQNHVVGFAKSLDRDVENMSHRALSTLTQVPRIRNNMIRKTYAGFNPGCETTLKDCPENFGLSVVDSFLITTNTKYGKPTYIDVKHMDAQARIEYYYHRRQYEQRTKTHIPIIASHFAVSGERQALAVATGLRPNYDKYEETEDQEEYYRKQILREGYQKSRGQYWKDFMVGKDWPKLNKKDQILSPMEKALYTPLNFLNPDIFNDQVYDPFDTSDTLRNFYLEKEKMGWYYPWSINLFDEEIVEINKSGGFIGVMMDPRQLGAYMPKYKNHEITWGKAYRAIADTISDATLSKYGLNRSDLSTIDYFKTEPFLRNIFYIVQVIKKQQEAEAYYSANSNNYDLTKERYRNYIADSLTCDQDPWDMITIGGDFDGFIDPIDFCPTAAYVPLLHRRMIVYSYIYAQMHHSEFQEPSSGNPYIMSFSDSENKMHRFFYQNLRDFIVKYF